MERVRELPREKVIGKYCFKQLLRTNHYALYEVWNRGYVVVVGYLVCKIRVKPMPIFVLRNGLNNGYSSFESFPQIEDMFKIVNGEVKDSMGRDTKDSVFNNPDNHAWFFTGQSKWKYAYDYYLSIKNQ